MNQANKVRGCDSATVNFVNVATVIQEKLQLPSTDQNVAVIMRLWSEAKGCPIEGWVLDEKKAYRQIPIKPDQRRFSVICFKNPKNHALNFFVMIGHSFGLVAAVYNYNRRSALIDEILRRLFGLVSFCYYDDKYGCELQTSQIGCGGGQGGSHHAGCPVRSEEAPAGSGSGDPGGHL